MCLEWVDLGDSLIKLVKSERNCYERIHVQGSIHRTDKDGGCTFYHHNTLHSPSSLNFLEVFCSFVFL